MSAHENKSSTFGERLYEALADAGWSAARLAKRIGVSASTITRDWKSAKHPPDQDKAFEAADELGVEGVWLATGHGPKRSAETAATSTRSRREKLPADVVDLLQRLEDALIYHLGRSGDRPMGRALPLAKRGVAPPHGGDDDKS